MNLQRLDLNLLVVLDALLTEQNVTRAAERMNVSQPAMSGSLQRLRAHFDDALLEPAGHHRLKLTSRARRLAGPLKDLLKQMDATLSGLPDFDPSTARQDVHITMSSYCAHVFGARLIADVRTFAPLIKCRLHDLTESSISGVSNGDYDFCVTIAERNYLDPFSRFTELRAEPAFVDRFVVVASSRNTEIGKSLALEDYRALPLVEVRILNNVLSMPERVLACYDRPANVVAVVSSFHLAMATVSGTNMVAMVPALLAESLGRSLDLKWYKPAFALPALSETLIWHERNDTDPVHQWMRQRFKLVATALQDSLVAGPRNVVRHSKDAAVRRHS